MADGLRDARWTPDASPSLRGRVQQAADEPDAEPLLEGADIEPLLREGGEPAWEMDALRDGYYSRADLDADDDSDADFGDYGSSRR